jgi:ABC-type sugar transport system substrate-binding protein
VIIRLLLGTAVLLAMLGAAPPAVEATAQPAPFRFAVVTPDDNPQYIRVRYGRHQSRVVRVRSSKKMVWRYV